MHNIKLIFSILLTICFASTCWPQVYQIDLDGPLHLTDQIASLSIPTSVSVFLSKPTMGFDRTHAEDLLKTNSAAYSTTNKTEIKNLISILQQEDYEQRITNQLSLIGRTYHILLFRDENKTMMQYRVFEPIDVKSVWFGVYPRTATGFNYFNKDIGFWLHSRLTNSTALTH